MALGPLILLIAAGVTLFWLSQHLKPETRRWLFGGLGVVLVFALYIFAVESPNRHPQLADNEARHTAFHLADSEVPSKTVKTDRRGKDMAMTVIPEHGHQLEGESIDKSEATPQDDHTDSPAHDDSHGELVDAPKWVIDPPRRIGDSYFVVVRSGQYSDPNVRDEMLDTKILAAAEKYVSEMLYRNDPNILDVVHLNPATLREQCVREQYPAESDASGVDETFVRLEFDRKFREGVEQSRKRNVTRQRVEQSALIVAGVLTVLGATLVYLKTTTPRPGE